MFAIQEKEVLLMKALMVVTDGFEEIEAIGTLSRYCAERKSMSLLRVFTATKRLDAMGLPLLIWSL